MTDPITHEAETGIRQIEAYLAQHVPIPHQIAPRLPLARQQRDLLDLGFDSEDCIAREQRILRETAHLNDERMIDVGTHSSLRAAPLPVRAGSCRGGLAWGDRGSGADRLVATKPLRRYWSRAAKRQRERVLFWRRVRFLGVCVVASALVAYAVQAVMWAAF